MSTLVDRMRREGTLPDWAFAKGRIKLAWTLRFGLSAKKACLLTPEFMAQLSRCKDDSARRLILGCPGGQADASDAAGMPSCEELGRLELDFETQKGGF